VDRYGLETPDACLQNRGEWKTFNSNFDSVPNGMMALFISATKKGWIEIMN
jgi:hypothetical protein